MPIDPTITHRDPEHYGEVEDLTFYRASDRGVVHVLRERKPNPMVEGLEGQPGADLLGAMFAHWIARCGRRHMHDPMRGTVESFPDEHLCQRCRAATPEDERVTLYGHPTDEGTEQREEN